jgi:sec-independent protein translocase protein TatA
MEWGVVAIIAVAVVLAGSKLPQLARNVGRAQGEFKKGIREGAVDEPEPTPPAQAAPPTTQASPPVAEQPRPAEQPPAE